MVPEIFGRGTDSSNEGAKMQLIGYYKLQEFSKNSFPSSDGGKL